MQNEASQHPGLILKQKFLDPLGISPSELADSIGVSTRRVSELLKGRRGLSPEMAHRLALYFNVRALWFLEMQARFDAQMVTNLKDIRKSVRPIEDPDGFIITPGGALPLQQSKSGPPTTLMVPVSEELLTRLRAQAALSNRKVNRTPKVITLPDGTPILTGD